MTRLRVLDVSRLPTVVFGARTTPRAGFLGVIVVEGMMILLIIVAYFYLATRSTDWPPGLAPPPLSAAIVNTILLLLSVPPAISLKRAAARAQLGRVRALLLVLSAIAATTLAVNGWGFASMNVRWDSNAYGSLVWMLLGTHALALSAAALLIWVLTIFMFVAMVEGRRYVNVYESANYWLLAGALWLPTALVIYAAPHLL